MGKAKSRKLRDLMRNLEYKKKQESKEQKQEATRIILEAAYNDNQKHEIVSRTTFEQVLGKLSEKYPEIQISNVPQVEKGLVLSNDYGQGAFQLDF